MLLVSAALYLVDVGSDIFLAHRYYQDNHVWWCGLTITFVIIPWLYIMYLAKVQNGIGIPFIASIFNLLPVRLVLIN